MASTTLATLLTVTLTQATPTSLAAALTKTALASTSTQVEFLTQLHSMFSLTPLKSGLASAILAAAVSIPLTVQNQREKREQSFAVFQNQIVALEKSNEELRSRVNSFDNRPNIPDEQFRELLRLRGELGVLRDQNRAFVEKNLRLQEMLDLFSHSTDKVVTTNKVSAPVEKWARVKVNQEGEVFLDGNAISYIEFAQKCVEIKNQEKVVRIFLEHEGPGWTFEPNERQVQVMSLLAAADIGMSAAFSEEDLEILPGYEPVQDDRIYPILREGIRTSAIPPKVESNNSNFE